MTDQHITGLLLVLALMSLVMTAMVAVLCLRNWFGPVRRERRRHAVYPLYELRHQLVALVARGEIDEGSETFKFLYAGINSLIRDLNHVSFRELVEALKREDLFKEDVLESYNCLCDHEHSEVSYIASRLFGVVASVLTSFEWSCSLWFLERIQAATSGAIDISSLLVKLFSQLGWRDFHEEAITLGKRAHMRQAQLVKVG